VFPQSHLLNYLKVYCCPQRKKKSSTILFFSVQAPDAFFYVGKTGKPETGKPLEDGVDSYKIAYPENQPRKILKGQSNAEIILKLPNHLKTSDLLWLSVWCREYSINFGDVFFKKVPGNKASKMSAATAVTIFMGFFLARFY